MPKSPKVPYTATVACEATRGTVMVLGHLVAEADVADGRKVEVVQSLNGAATIVRVKHPNGRELSLAFLLEPMINAALAADDALPAVLDSTPSATTGGA